MNATATTPPPPPEIVHDDFPPPDMPVIYADGVSTAAPAQQTVKFFLARVEPHLRAENRTLVQPITQVVMPLAGFLQTAFFFENIVKNMEAQGTITPDQIAEARKIAGARAS
jgi:hypothetical protein